MDINLEKLGVSLKIDLTKPIFQSFDKQIGFEDLFGNIKDKNNNQRCTIKYKQKTVSGGYGVITFGTRIEKYDTKDCVVKRLIENQSLNLFKEAFLQHVSYLKLKQYNLNLFISEVYDIFYKFDRTINKYVLHFCMEEIKGDFMHTFLKCCTDPEKDFLDCFIQISIALYILQKELNLDHRDLRYANIYIVQKPISIKLTVLDKEINYTCRFHICILDFGFACIGHKPTLINAAEGFMQNEERCYKPGRDLFQLLISVWCKKEIRLRMNESFIKKIDSILCYEGHDYSKILELNSDSKWPYSLTMDDNFSYVPLMPKNLLIKLVELKNEHDK